MGILVPCLTVAFSLFCVMTLGFESNLPTPLASAMVMKKSTAKFGDRCEKLMPDVGAFAGKFVFRGVPAVMPFPLAVPLPQITGDGTSPPVMPLQPTAGLPLKSDRPPVV